jgi:hypothetical protein
LPYIGVQPSTSFQTLAKQDFSTSATTSYTLSQSVSSANDIALFINNVRQEPTYAYSASGTALTLTAATSGSDDMYCIYLGKSVGTINPASGSVGVGELSATGTKNSTTFLRGDNTFATPVSGSNILEVVTGACDGRTVSTSNGNITLANVNATQQLTTTFADVTGSSITYTPPTGTTHLRYLFEFHYTVGSGSALGNYLLDIDGTEVTNARHVFYGGGGKINVEYVFLTNASSEDVAKGHFTSWSSNKTIKIQGEEFNSSNTVQLHEIHYWNNTTGAGDIAVPLMTITAYKDAT